MTKIDRLRKLTADEKKRLKDNKVETVEDLWKAVGMDLAKGIEKVSTENNIDRTRLSEALKAQAKSGILIDFLRQHSVDFAAILLAVAAVLLVLRASGTLPPFLDFLSMKATVPVASHNLLAGEIIQKGDFVESRLQPGNTYFTTAVLLPGLMLSRDLDAGKPLQLRDVLRSQVVAARDIGQGDLIARDALSLTWSIYQRDAFTRTADVENRKAEYSLHAGEIIPFSAIGAGQELVQQVVVSATTDLPPYHLIHDEDVTLKASREEPGAFTDTARVVGRYLLQSVSAGETLRVAQVTDEATSKALASRVLLSLSVDPNRVPPFQTPTSVSLLLVPRGSGSLSAHTLSDVIVLTRIPAEKPESLIVALTPAVREELQPYLGTSDVLVLQDLEK